MATITNYTTYDLDYYYADLKRLPRLSPEERRQLITLASATPTRPALSQGTQVKQQLIEGYLPFAKHLAITLCPPTLYQRLFLDLIGAVNLAVVEATMRCDLSSTMNLDAYTAAYVRGAIKRTIPRMICSLSLLGRGNVQERRVRLSTSKDRGCGWPVPCLQKRRE